MYFVSTKITDDLESLTASSEVATFEAINLQDPLGSFKWRSEGTTAFIEGEFTEEQLIDFWGLWYCNAQVLDYARLRLADSQSELVTNPMVDVVDFVRRDPRQGWPFGGAYAFDGTAFVDFGDVLDQGAGTDFAVSIRFRTEVTGINNGLANKLSGLVAGWQIRIDSSNVLTATIFDGIDTESATTDATPFQDGLWHEARMEVDHTLEVMRLYVDGALMDTSADISAVGDLSNTVSLAVGAGAGIVADLFDGQLDEFRFWDGTLPTAAESAAGLAAEFTAPIPVTLGLYWKANEGSGTTATDETSNGFDGTITNGFWIPTTNPAAFNASIAFAATGDVDFGDVPIATGSGDNFAVSIRFKTPISGTEQGLVRKLFSVAAPGWRMRITAGDVLSAEILDGVDTVTATTSAVPFQDDAFHEARMEVDRGTETIRLYVDNVLEDTSADTSAVGDLDNNESLLLGDGIGGDWNGGLDEFRFWSVLPTPAQSAAGFAAEFDEPIPLTLDLYWRANEGSGFIAFDKSANGFNGVITNGTWITPYIFTDGFESGDVSNWDETSGYHQIGNIDNPQPATWFRIDVNFATNPDGFAQAGALFLAPRLQFPNGQADNWRPTNRSSASRKSLLAGGDETRGDGANKRDVRFAIPGMTKDQAWGVFDPLVRERRNVRPVGVVLDDDDGSSDLYPMNYTYYGYIDASTPTIASNNKPVRVVRIREP